MNFTNISNFVKKVGPIIGLVTVIVGWGITIGTYRTKLSNLEKTNITLENTIRTLGTNLTKSIEDLGSNLESAIVGNTSAQIEHKRRYEKLLDEFHKVEVNTNIIATKLNIDIK